MYYGDLDPRIGVYKIGKLINRVVANRFLYKTAQKMNFPKNNGKTAIGRRYESLDIPDAAISEGITPSETPVSYTDVQATLLQWGAYIRLTDHVLDLHEDQIVSEFEKLLSEQMEKRLETLDWLKVTGGTNVFYANGTARTDVNTVIANGDLKVIERSLLAAEAQYYKRNIGGKPKDNTYPIASAFVACGHTDCKSDIENLTGYKAVHEYASPDMRLSEYEIGAVGNFRFVLHPWYTSYADAGGAKGTMKSTSGTLADVYPIVVLTEDCWASLDITQTMNSGKILLNMPKAISGDELAQRGSLGWKLYDAGMILNDTQIARLEVAVTNTPT